MKATMPNALILPSLGNNDVYLHYTQPIDPTMKSEYYQFLYEAWFEIQKDHPLL